MSTYIKYLSESAEYSDLEKNLAHFTRAIGHPARVAVLLEIARRGNRIYGEIIDVPQLSKATVLQHLRELKRAGFIHGRIFGVKSEYYLDTDLLIEFKKTFEQFMREFESNKLEIKVNIS